MERKRLNRGESLAVLALLLLFLGCRGPRQTREAVVPEPAPTPGRMGAGPWLLQLHQSNLWVRTPSGDAGYALTQSGRVVSQMLGGHELGWTSVAISPDGRQVAYVETAENPDANTPGGWSLLWVVNADGTGRRLLVDLRERTPLEGNVRAGPILWSSDGSRVAYVLYSYEKKPRVRTHYPLAIVDAVELATGRRETLFQWPERGSLFEPRGWSVKRGEFYFTFERVPPSPPEFTPWGVGEFVTLRLGSGESSRSPPARGSLSPDGQQLLLLPSMLRWGDKVGPSLWDGQALEVPRNFESFLVQRVAWMHGQPVAYLTTYRGAECIARTPPSELYRLEVGGSSPRLEQHTKYPWLLVLEFSPDDAYVLMAVVARHPQSRDGCALHSFESLLVAERSRFEASTSLEELIAASVRVDDPVSRLGRPLQGFIGWLR
ncbi:hypothetical protein F0U61_50825 [Archangium violaceum]|uniref:TolB family protein n=1 Tax=Archangium violaceum TaxID=83451 RepID=UPI002B2EADC7|nr:hypothetical protein F0U61_50825 [Archangium violaceum]